MNGEKRLFGLISFSLFLGVTIRVAILLLLAGVLGVIANTVLPSKISWVEDWGHYIAAQAYKEGFMLADFDDVRYAVDGGRAMLLDARPRIDFDEGHISGAFSLPSEEPETSEAMMILSPSDRLLIYCSGYECDDSLVLARYLRDAGFTNLLIYAGGWTEWSKQLGGTHE